MIRIERPEEGPEVLREARRRGPRELERARKSLKRWIAAGKDPKLWSFKFAAYKDKEVKTELEELFHGKCAYCESSYRGTQPMDVEHWRPKGQAVVDEDGEEHKPAYYWLAASWKNLLPSCIDCNRRRNQRDVVKNKTVSIGKEDQFPLAEPLARATEPGGELAEVPLLLHPCDDDPAEFLEFDTEQAVVRPSQDRGLEKRRAEASIRVYALNRAGLVLNRQELLKILELRIATVKGLAQILVDHPDLDEFLQVIIEELLMAELRELARTRRPDRPFSLMARQVIDRHMAELEALGIGDDLEPPPAA